MRDEDIIIVILLGFQGSGKDVGLDFLETEENFVRCSASDYLREEARLQELPSDYDSLKDIGDSIRGEEGEGAVVRRAVERLIQNGARRIAVGSVRMVQELLGLKENYTTFTMVVEAPIELRRKRVFERNREGDPKTLEEFRRRDLIDKRDGFELDKLFKLADITIKNRGTLDEYHENIRRELRRFEINDIEGNGLPVERR